MTIEEAKVRLWEYFEEACKVLDVNYQNILFVYEHIGERFKTVNNTCEKVGSCLYINEDWIAEILRHNFLLSFVPVISLPKHLWIFSH